MRAAPALLGFAAALGACATTGGTRAVYACEGGRGFVVAYAKDLAVLEAGGRTFRLAQAISGSGARYVGEGVELWGKGRGATLTGAPGGPYDGCSTP